MDNYKIKSNKECTIKALNKERNEEFFSQRTSIQK